MTRYFELLPPSKSNYEIVARRRFSLPGVTCDRCGATWSQTGMAFPEVALPVTLDERPYTSLAPVTVVEFAKLAAEIAAVFPEGLELCPGLGFGRLEGDVVRMDSSDFLWVNPWTLLAKTSVGDLLMTKLGLRVVPAHLRAVGSDPGLVELSIHPAGRADLKPTHDRCAKCGRVGLTREGKLRIIVRDGGEPPAIFRLSNLPTIVIGTQSFTDLLRSEGWTGVEAKEVRLAR